MTSEGVVATLDGKPLLSSTPVRWEIRAGVKSYEAEFDLRPADAEALLAGDLRPVTLLLTDGRGREVKIEKLYVIARAPAANEHLARVVVVDGRWWWDHAHVERYFNVRRSVGTKRQRAPNTPPELQPLTPEVAYAPFSLKQRRPWTAREIVENVLAKALRPESDATGETRQWVIDPDVGKLLDDLPVEDLELSDPAGVALRRVLAYMPEAEVVVEASGRVRVYSRASGAEKDLLRDAGAESVGKGHVELISNARLRPRKIHVLFTREHELRFDFSETDTETFSVDERYMQNVLAVPDYQLTVAGRTLAQGTWLDFPSALNAWGAPPHFSILSSAGAWLGAIRRAMVPFLDLWAGIGLAGAKDPRSDWMGRLGAIQAHYRQTFRISPRWMARIWQLKASKVATIDPTTGTRAPALAYADYSRVGSQRSLRTRGGAGIAFMNVVSSPTSSLTEPAGPPAPFDVVIADHDQGIVHLAMKPDVVKIYETTLPSMVVLGEGGVPGTLPLDSGPTDDIDDVSRPIAFNALGDTHAIPQLTPNHRVAVILTASPAGNNSQDANHLQRLTVTPEDVAGILPPALRAGILDSRGPEMEIRVGATIETARVAWMLSRAQDIDAAFGVGEVGDPALGADIDDLIVNLEGDVEGGASLKAITHAVAARTWAALTDRHQGSKTVRLFPLGQPTGSAGTVAHQIDPSGAAETEIALPERLPSIDVFSLLPESTRRLVLRLVQSPGKVPR